jgi:hypothetical protein
MTGDALSVNMRSFRSLYGNTPQTQQTGNYHVVIDADVAEDAVRLLEPDPPRHLAPQLADRHGRLQW